VYERTGFPNLLVGLSNDMSGGWKTVTVQTGFGANVQLHDYSGRSGDLWTDSQGNATLGIPPNNNGQGYVCYSHVGQDKPNPVRRFATMQLFEGSDDLDIRPAVPGQNGNNRTDLV
jgi:alpha-amylase